MPASSLALAPAALAIASLLDGRMPRLLLREASSPPCWSASYQSRSQLVAGSAAREVGAPQLPLTLLPMAARPPRSYLVRADDGGPLQALRSRSGLVLGSHSASRWKVASSYLRHASSCLASRASVWGACGGPLPGPSSGAGAVTSRGGRPASSVFSVQRDRGTRSSLPSPRLRRLLQLLHSRLLRRGGAHADAAEHPLAAPQGLEVSPPDLRTRQAHGMPTRAASASSSRKPSS